jgi:hypothetical protein
VNELDDAIAQGEHIDGRELLDKVADAIRRYVVLSNAQRDALAVWCAHCHAFEAADATPYPHVTSAERESGKTRLLELLALLTPGALHLSNTTTAALARSVSQEPPPTLLLDESDNTLKREREYVAALLSILNDGYRRGGQTLLCLPPKWEPALLPVFSPKAIAGLGTLPDTVASRSIRIELKRKTKDERVERFRRREALAVLVPLRQALETWAQEHVDTLTAARPELPDELGDRAQDVWEPLLAIADLAGADWPQRARTAALELSAGQNIDEESVRVRLLYDIRAAFDTRQVERISSAELVEALNADDEAPWGDWYGKQLTARTLAKMLRPFAIRPHVIRLASETARGYAREHFEDAFARYLDSDSLHTDSVSVTTVTTAWLSQKGPVSMRNTESPVTHSEEAANPHERRDVTVVTDTEGGRGDSGAIQPYLIDENGRCKRHPDEPMVWCLECRPVVA